MLNMVHFIMIIYAMVNFPMFYRLLSSFEVSYSIETNINYIQVIRTTLLYTEYTMSGSSGEIYERDLDLVKLQPMSYRFSIYYSLRVVYTRNPQQSSLMLNSACPHPANSAMRAALASRMFNFIKNFMQYIKDSALTSQCRRQPFSTYIINRILTQPALVNIALSINRKGKRISILLISIVIYH